MKDGYQVEPQGITEHANSIREITPMIDLVLDAGAQVTPGGWDNAYGLACQVFPIAIRPIANKQLDMTDKVRGALESTMNQLRQTAQEYEQREQENEQRMMRQQQERDKGFHEDIFVPGNDGAGR